MRASEQTLTRGGRLRGPPRVSVGRRSPATLPAWHRQRRDRSLKASGCRHHRPVNHEVQGARVMVSPATGKGVLSRG